MTENGRSSRNATCARKMLIASLVFMPKRSKTCSALWYRAVSTRARRSVLFELFMAQMCSITLISSSACLAVPSRRQFSLFLLRLNIYSDSFKNRAHFPPAVGADVGRAKRRFKVASGKYGPGVTAYTGWMGRSRIRFPLAANTALHMAGGIGGTPGSPTPAGGAVDWTRCTCTSRGASGIRAIG